MPQIYSATDIALGLNAPPRIVVTPKGCTAVFLINQSNLQLVLSTQQGAVPIPPYVSATIPIQQNEQIQFSPLSTVAAFPPSVIAPLVDAQFGFSADPQFVVRNLITQLSTGVALVWDVSSEAVAAGANVFATPYTPPEAGELTITAGNASSGAATVLSVVKTSAGVAQTFALNSGQTLAAGDLYAFTFTVTSSCSYNLKSSAATTLDVTATFNNQ